MANTFKNASLVDVGQTAETLYSTPAATTTVILGVALANKNAYNVKVTLEFTDTSATTTAKVIPEVTIPGNTTLEVLAGQKYILEATDVLKCTCDTASSLDVTLGIMEIS